MERGRVYRVAYRRVINKPDWAPKVEDLEFRGVDGDRAVFYREFKGGEPRHHEHLRVSQIVSIDEIDPAELAADPQVVAEMTETFGSFLRNAREASQR